MSGGTQEDGKVTGCPHSHFCPHSGSDDCEGATGNFEACPVYLGLEDAIDVWGWRST